MTEARKKVGVNDFWFVRAGDEECRKNSFFLIVVSYFEIVFSVLTGFSVNFTLGKKAVGIYLGIYEDMHQSKGNMSMEVFDCVKIETDIVCDLQWSQNNGTWT
jgi:hypothetical protein